MILPPLKQPEQMSDLTIDWENESILVILPSLEKAVSESDVDLIAKLDLIISDYIEKKGINSKDLKESKDQYRKLYDLIRQSESILYQERERLKKERSTLNKKRDGSKEYSEIGKL